MTRIKGSDTVQDAMVALGEGNPGALTVMLQALSAGEAIDPDAALGGLGVLLSLDQEGIYGPRIWMLYKDVCGEHLGKTLGVLRAIQLGFVASATVHHAIDNYGQGLDVDDLVGQVCTRLPAFTPDHHAAG